MSQSLEDTPTWLTTLTEFEQYQLLASDRRRLTIELLSERELPVTLDTVAEAVTRQEQGREDVTEAAVKRVAATLHHVHLPALTDAGVIVYDPENHRIRS